MQRRESKKRRRFSRGRGSANDALIAAIGQRVSGRTKQLLPVGSLYLQPTEERRRSGSHYTPRKLTQPIVENTLRPILAGLGDTPTAAQILELKVCDLAMGSGAFLHALKCGDSLVGRTRREINAFGQIESPLKGSPIGEELNKKLLEVKLFRAC